VSKTNTRVGLKLAQLVGGRRGPSEGDLTGWIH